MNQTIHVLGADIPHHNETILGFFNDVLSTEQPVPVPRQFMVVAQNSGTFQAYDQLRITVFRDKKSLARAVVRQARDREKRFFWHGQFNPWLWLALLCGLISKHQVLWHVWGADLYEQAQGLKYRLFWMLRRMAQGKVAHLFATYGDIHHYQQRYPDVPASLLYFPTRMPLVLSEPKSGQRNDKLTILLGNSGDASNRHLQALEDIRRQFGDDLRVIIPLGYPPDNHELISQIRHTAQRLLPASEVTLITRKMAFEEYVQLIQHCDLGYFIFERQQGVGTLCLLIQADIPFVLSRQNPFWRDLQECDLPMLFNDQPVSRQDIVEACRQLSLKDKSQITFFNPGFIQGWKEALIQAEEGKA